MLATSHHSAHSGSNMSQNSVSPLHSSGPLTPPETGMSGGLPLQSPATPGSRRSPRSVRKSIRPTPSPIAYPQPGSYDHMIPQTMSPANLMPPPQTHTPGQSFGNGLMASPIGFPSPVGTASPSQFSSYTGSYPTTSYFPSQPMTYSLSQHSSQSSKLYQSETDAEAEGETDFDSLSFAVDLDLELDSAKPSAAASKLSTTSPSKLPKSKDVNIPRPANAWILYRSDKLKDISAGREIKGLDDVMREAGYSASSASSGEESGLDRTSDTTPATSLPVTDDDGAKPKVKKQRRPKKGAKEPTEGLLSLGRGKTGRGLPQAHISKMISMLWKKESAEVRSKYEELSEQRKREHAEKYPDYKYQPMRRADKMRIKELKDMEKDKEKYLQKQEKQREREIRRAAATRERDRERGVQKPRNRPSTAPYDHQGRQGLSRSKSHQTLRQPYGSPQKPRRSVDPSSRVNPAELYEYQPFPFMIGYQPNAHHDQGAYQMPLASSSAEQSRLQSRQHSPSKTHTPQLQAGPSMPQAQPSPYPTQDPSLTHGPIDPALYGQYGQPAVQPHPYVQPGQPFYADMTGLGPVYAQPVTFEPQSLPDSIDLDAMFPVFDPGTQTQNPEDQLIEQWVVMEEMDGTSGDANAVWPQDPEAAASDWANLSGDAQEQFFQDLDLSHAMAVQLMPEIDLTPWDFTSTDGQVPDLLQPNVDYSSGYLNVPYYTEQPASETTPQMESGPFLSVQRPMSPDRDITPRQSHFAQNMVNTLEDPDRSARVPSTSNSNPGFMSRYVSASAFPDTPLSVDPSGLGGIDRRISYAQSDLQWQTDLDEQSQSQESSYDETSIKSEHASPTKLDMPLSPLPEDNVSSPSTPSDVGSPLKPSAPRSTRRARSVASSFA